MIERLPDNAENNLRRMRFHRRMKGVSLSEIAKRLKIDVDNLKEYEKGRKIPDEFDYEKLSAFFSWCDYFAPRFRFRQGEIYKIPNVGLNKHDSTDFYYIEKRVNHHIFQSVAGGWKISFTDAQLVGREIEEVVEE